MHGRYECYVALVEAIADHDLCALDLIREHNATNLPVPQSESAAGGDVQ